MSYIACSVAAFETDSLFDLLYVNSDHISFSSYFTYNTLYFLDIVLALWELYASLFM